MSTISLFKKIKIKLTNLISRDFPLSILLIKRLTGKTGYCIFP